jgi:hypothetical protein
MSELAGFGMSWLPAAAQGRIEAEERAEEREARRAEAEREVQREQRHESAMAAYAAAAGERGEVVSALAIARGEVAGRTVGDVFADALAAADREDARSASRQRREDGDVVFIDSEPRIHGVSRSAWPASEWELDRTLRQASELHRDLVAVRARYDYPAAEMAARAKTGEARELARRYQAQNGYSGEITRTASADGMGQLGDYFGNVIR